MTGAVITCLAFQLGGGVVCGIIGGVRKWSDLRTACTAFVWAWLCLGVLKVLG